MAGIQDFLKAIGNQIGVGPNPDQLGLADILGAIGGVAGPILANRGGSIGGPLGLGLSTVGQLGATLADKQQRSQQGQSTYAALRGMLPLIKDKVPGAETMLEGVRTGAITTDEFLKHVETYTKPDEGKDLGLVFDKPSGQWIYEQKKPGPLGAGQTPVDVWKELNKPKTERELTGEAAIQARSLGLPLDPSTWTPEQGAKARAAHLEDILAARPPREGREPPSPTKGKRTFYDAKTGAFLGMFYGTGDQPKGSSPRPPSVIKPSKPTIKVFKETGPDGRGYLVKRRIDRPGSPAVGVDVDPTAETAIGRYFGAAKAPPLSAFPDLPEPGPGSEGAPVDEVP